MCSLLYYFKRNTGAGNFCLILYSVLFLIFFQSCVLTGSQVKVTKNFYSSVDEVDRQCRTLNEASSTVTYERRLLSPENYSNDSNIVKELVDNYEIYSKEVSSIDSFTISVNALGSYFNNFSSLLPLQKSSPQVYDRKVLSAIENFSSYLPFGIGLTIYKTLYDLVSYTARFIKIPHSRKKMKKYIIKGENLVAGNSEYIIQELQETSRKLETEKELMKQNYLKFLNDQKVNKSPYDYYQTYNPVFLKKYHLASSALELSNALIELIPEVRNAYAALYAETQERKRIKNEIPGFSEMYSGIGKASRQYVIVNEALKQNKSH